MKNIRFDSEKCILQNLFMTSDKENGAKGWISFRNFFTTFLETRLLKISCFLKGLKIKTKLIQNNKIFKVLFMNNSELFESNRVLFFEI